MGIREKAMRLLSMRDHSAKELRQKLREKFELPEIESLIEELTLTGYLRPPEILAENLKASLDRKGKGQNYIKRKIQEKGLPQPKLNEEIEQEKALVHLGKKFKQQPLNDHQLRAKAHRYLFARGFTMGTIRQAVDLFNKTNK